MEITTSTMNLNLDPNPNPNPNPLITNQQQPKKIKKIRKRKINEDRISHADFMKLVDGQLIGIKKKIRENRLVGGFKAYKRDWSW